MSDDHVNQNPEEKTLQFPIAKNGTDVQDHQVFVQQCAENGVMMRRVKREHVGQAKPVFLVDENKQLQYYTFGFLKIIPPRQKAVKIGKLAEVRTGFGTDRLQKAAKNFSFQRIASEENCVSVIFRKRKGKKQKTIDFVAASLQDKMAFMNAIEYVIEKERIRAADFNEKQWIIDKFHAADVNHAGKLNFREVWRLLKEMNLNISQDYAKALFQSADVGRSSSGSEKDGYLDQEEFLRFFLKLTCQFEVRKIMHLYSTRHDETFSADDLKNFLTNEQQFEGIDNNLAASIIDDIIVKQGNYRVEKSKHLLGPVGFRLLLRSRWGNILRNGHENVFQDMHQPLSHYYVNSSHNTYLMGAQVNGEATVEGYINAIKKGARLLELDVLDGAYGEPCITHRGTLVTSIFLKDALRAIKNYAFKYSPYPLILTIENHCSLEQQQAMARTFIEVLGNDIYLIPGDEPLTELPSPEQLKYKYLLRGKAGSAANGCNAEKERDEDNEEPRSPIDPALSKLISLPQIKLTRNLCDDIEKHPVNTSASISETKVLKFLQDNENFATYTSKHLVKSYPKGLRQDSSNFCPILSWTYGIQSVALNMQTHDENMDLNSGFFRMNGNCGYILKPLILIRGLDPIKTGNVVRMIMNLTVISGEYLPKPFSKNGEIIDPYVITEIYGIPEDCIKHRTKVVDDNGFCPVWNDVFKFELRHPELAMLRLCVKDYDIASADDFIGEFSIPVTSIRPGYSIVSLYTGQDRILDPSAAILIHVDFEHIRF